VVRDVEGKNGCSLGPLTNYVVFESTADCATHLAHELGHACGLWHLDDTDNLMFHSCSGKRNRLAGWQKNVVRAAKYVTYF